MKTVYHNPINEPATGNAFVMFFRLYRTEALYEVRLYDVWGDSYRFSVYAASREDAAEKAFAFAAKEGIKDFEMSIKMVR